MIVENRKTEKVNRTISFRRNLKDDNENVFAYMSATIDERRPLGITSFSVINQELYASNAVEAQEEYKKFQNEVVNLAINTVVFSEILE